MLDYFKIIEVPSFDDERGSIFIIEKELPFDIQRIFWIYGNKNHIRGGHRHHKTRLALVCIRGYVDVYANDGVKDATVTLCEANQCLLIEPKDWHTMEFKEDSILLVMASEPYNEIDYIDEQY